MKNILVAQSGGPTAAINATLTGVIDFAFGCSGIDKVYGGVYGIKGILDKRIIEFNKEDFNEDELTILSQTPGAALGSCRFKLSDNNHTFEKIIAIFREFNIGYFVYIGGNDSMDTVDKLSAYIETEGIDDIFVMGAPKTIDNDLPETDHTPGFGSAAKYVATSILEIICDIRVYDIKAVTIVEIMGRNTGWLAASSALSCVSGLESPDLIYLPEIPFDYDRFTEDLNGILQKKPFALVVVSEGIKNADGKYISESDDGKLDAFGHAQLSGAAKYLETYVKRRIGCKVRSMSLDLLQRCAAHSASACDLRESRELGYDAAKAAFDKISGKMTAIKRISDSPYKTEIFLADVSKIANNEKKVPKNFINEKGNHITDEMLDYLRPLIIGETSAKFENGVPVFKRLFEV